MRVNTALEYAKKDERFIKKHLSKPYVEIWNELNGRSVYPVAAESKDNYKSISKFKTFTPPSDDETFIYAQLSKNLENACIKARRYSLAASKSGSYFKAAGFQKYRCKTETESPQRLPC